MKRSIISIMAAAAILGGCHNAHTHEGHDHEGEEVEHVHDHDHEDEHEHTHKHTANCKHDHDHEHEADEHGHDHEHEHEAGESGHQHQAGEIELSEERQKTLGIEVESIEAAPFSEVIHTSGKIISATGDEMTIVARSAGIVKLGNLTEGASIAKGARVATISSKNLGTGDLLTKARIAYETAKKEYERDLQLREDNIVSESHLDQSRLTYETAKAEYDALTAGGASENGITITSPMAGFIKSLNVKEGDYVETGSAIATVSQNRRLRLRADVSEKYYSMIGQISDANFTTSSSGKTYSLKDLGGRFVSYGKTTDDDFYVPVTFEFDNKGDIVAGSYVEVFLKTAATQNAIAIPLSAVIEDQGVNYVFIQHEEDAFLKKEVVLGQSDGEKVLVKSGLEEGEVIVVKGAMHVKLASIQSIPAGHSHNH